MQITKLTSEVGWTFKEALPFPKAVRVGSRTIVGGVLPLNERGEVVEPGDIEAQTHAVFQNMRRTLAGMGCRMEDLVRINTYYVYDGAEDQATRYWEKMTRVRLQYFPDPGPVGTAVRVRGIPLEGALIQIEAEAVAPEKGRERKRIMPDESWDWSIPIPLSQGWRIDDHVWVGGQIAADRAGRAVALGDIDGQTRNVMMHIANVLRDSGGSFADLIHLKICYMHRGDSAEAKRGLETIMRVVDEVCPTAVHTPTTAFGVNLLYEGLMLEIDATAVIGGRSSIAEGATENANWPARKQAAKRGNLVYVSGQSPARSHGLRQDALDALGQVLNALAGLQVSPERLAKLTVFLSPGLDGDDVDRILPELGAALTARLGPNAPAVTVARVTGLPGNDVGLQMDAVAIL